MRHLKTNVGARSSAVSAPAEGYALTGWHRAKRLADVAAGHSLRALARVAPLPAHLREAAHHLTSGNRTIVGPMKAEGALPAGLLNEAVINNWMGIDGLVQGESRYEARLANDARILMKAAWARLLAAPGQSAHEADALRLLGLTINNLNATRALGALDALIRTRHAFVESYRHLQHEAFRTKPVTVCFANAHNMNLFVEHPPFAKAMSGADVVLPDGIGLKIAAGLTGQRMSENLNGTDLLPALLELCEESGLRVFLLGAENEVLERAVKKLQAQCPRLRIAGFHHGYFSEHEEPAIAAAINASGADVVIAGMGTPRQELWMERNASELRVAAVFCMGGILDFLGGKNRRAPLWVRQAGLEWVYRITQEPRRMWRRYVVGNPKFLLRVHRSLRTPSTPTNSERALA